MQAALTLECVCQDDSGMVRAKDNHGKSEKRLGYGILCLFVTTLFAVTHL